jgi:hypothetical protein
MAHETKAERFKRLATKRTQNVLYALRVLGNCANRGVYEYTNDDVKKIFNAIEKQVDDTKTKFKDTGSLEFKL